jgi:hypothetical protein
MKYTWKNLRSGGILEIKALSSGKLTWDLIYEI